MDDAQMKDRVQALLDTSINPSVAMHGGHIHLVDVKDGVVFIQMAGGCQGCGAADLTLRAGVEQLIRREIPEVKEIRDATDHAAGSSPYYSPS